jgi:hypothetical protein
MGAKGSKGSKGERNGVAKSPKAAAGGTPVKLQLPPKKIKKESPYDLQFFVFLGGKVVEEFVEVPREATVATSKDGLAPPKPLSEMSPDERQAWDAEVEKHEKKIRMQSLMEKNLQQKIKHGDKPIEPPVQGGLLGKAKKKIQQAQEKVATKAEEFAKPTETIEERVKKQAMAGAQGTLTGGATAALGQDIAKSQQVRDLEKKRKEFAKQEEDKKKKEEEERKKKEEDKKKNKPKGLNDFLQQVEGDGDSAVSSSTAAAQSPQNAGAKLRAFIEQSQGPAYAVAEKETQAEVPASPVGESPEQRAKRLQAFLAAAETSPPTNTTQRGKYQMSNPSCNTDTDLPTADDSPAATAVAQDSADKPAAEPEPVKRAPSNRLTAFLSASDGAGAADRRKSESKLGGFLGAAMRRLSSKPAAPGDGESSAAAQGDVKDDATKVKAEGDAGADEAEAPVPSETAPKELPSEPEQSKPDETASAPSGEEREQPKIEEAPVAPSTEEERPQEELATAIPE